MTEEELRDMEAETGCTVAGWGEEQRKKLARLYDRARNWGEEQRKKRTWLRKEAKRWNT